MNKTKVNNNTTKIKKAILAVQKVNKGHYHEATDRIHVVQSIIEDHLQRHPAFKKNKGWAKKLEDVQDIMGELYQLAGAKM